MDNQDLALGQKSLIVFGAARGMGLTIATLQIANYLALREKVCFISYQDYNASLKRNLAEFDEEQEHLLSFKDNLSFLNPLFINELTQLIQNNSFSTIVIDSLDYLYGDNPSPRQVIRDQLIRDLKSLVALTGCTIILNVWLSDRLENRSGDKRPIYRDLVWCRQLSALADQIFAIYRPAYYGLSQRKIPEETKNELEIISLKNESGSAYSVKYVIQKKIQDSMQRKLSLVSQGLIVLASNNRELQSQFLLKLAHQISRGRKTLFISWNAYKESVLASAMKMDDMISPNLVVLDERDFFTFETNQGLRRPISEYEPKCLVINSPDTMTGKHACETEEEREKFIEYLERLSKEFNLRVILDFELEKTSKSTLAYTLVDVNWSRFMVASSSQVFLLKNVGARSETLKLTPLKSPGQQDEIEFSIEDLGLDSTQ